MCLLSRKDWEDRAAKLGAAFNVSVAAGTLSEVILRRARKLHDGLFASASARAEGGVAKPHHVHKVVASFVSVLGLGKKQLWRRSGRCQRRRQRLTGSASPKTRIPNPMGKRGGPRRPSNPAFAFASCFVAWTLCFGLLLRLRPKRFVGIAKKLGIMPTVALPARGSTRRHEGEC